MKALCLSALLFLVSGVAFAADTSPQQDTTTLHYIRTYEAEFIGRIRVQDENQVHLIRENLPDTTLRREDIRTLREIRPGELRNGAYWPWNELAARYTLLPSAYGLKGGDGYYQNTLLMLNQVHVGITDNISLAGGSMLPVTVNLPVFVAAKVSVPLIDSLLHIAAGGFAGGVLGSSGPGYGYYGLVTYGAPDNNITLGAGHLPLLDELLMVYGGVGRLSSNFYLVTEGALSVRRTGVILRTASATARMTFDYGSFELGVYVPAVFIIAFPYAGVTITF